MAYELIVVVKDVEKFSNEVTAKLNNGYTLHGSPSAVYNEYSKQMSYSQAVIKEDQIKSSE